MDPSLRNILSSFPKEWTLSAHHASLPWYPDGVAGVHLMVPGRCSRCNTLRYPGGIPRCNTLRYLGGIPRGVHREVYLGGVPRGVPKEVYIGGYPWVVYTSLYASHTTLGGIHFPVCLSYCTTLGIPPFRTLLVTVLHSRCATWGA